MDITKYPVNERGFTVIPCIALTAENMSDDLIGFTVTIGLSEVGIPTSAGVIEGYTDSQLSIKVGTKVKKYPYDPENIALQVYQFEKRIMFSNVVPSPRTHTVEKDSKTEEDKKAERNVEKRSNPTTKKRKPKQKKEAPKPQRKTKQTTGRYKPKFGIVWENEDA